MAPESVTEFVLRITGANPGVGSGFVCGTTETGTLIATCDHVVKDLGEPLLVGVQPATVRVRGSDRDVAVLEVASKPAWAMLRRAAPIRGGKVVAVGWYHGDQGDSAESRVGTVDDLTQLTYPETATAWHRGLVAAMERPIERGYSGGPLIAVGEEMVVVGVLRWRQGGTRAYATDAREIDSLLTGLVAPSSRTVNPTPGPNPRTRSRWSLAVPFVAAVGVWWWIQRSEEPPRPTVDCGMPAMTMTPVGDLREWCPRARTRATVTCGGSSRDGTVVGVCEDQLPRGVWESRSNDGALLWRAEVGRAGKDQPVRVGTWEIRSPINPDSVVRSEWRAMCSSSEHLARLTVDCADSVYTRDLACDGTATWTIANGGLTLVAYTDKVGNGIGVWPRTGSSTELRAEREALLDRLANLTIMQFMCDVALVRVPGLTAPDVRTMVVSMVAQLIGLHGERIQQGQRGAWCERSTIEVSPVRCAFDSLETCQREGNAAVPGACFPRPSVLFCYAHYTPAGAAEDRCFISRAACDAHRGNPSTTTPCVTVPMLDAP